MRIIRWFRTFFKKLFTSNSDFIAMERESKFYSAMMSLVHVNRDTEYVNAKNSNGATIMRFPKSDTYTVSVNIRDMLEAGGFAVDDSVKWDVKWDC